MTVIFFVPVGMPGSTDVLWILRWLSSYAYGGTLRKQGRKKKLITSIIRFSVLIKQKRLTRLIYWRELQTHGLLCTVDLFPVPTTALVDRPPSLSAPAMLSPRIVLTNEPIYLNPSGPPHTPSLEVSPPYRPRSYGPSDIVHYYEGGYPVLEQSKTTHALVGTTFVQPVLVELSGKKCIVFVFSVRLLAPMPALY